MKVFLISISVSLIIGFSCITVHGQTQTPVQRRELNAVNFTPGELEDLRDLILQWTATSHDHTNCDCHGNNDFFSWHREHLGHLEEWLWNNNGKKFVPLPKWSPDQAMPTAFTGLASVVDPLLHDPPANTDPQQDTSRWNRQLFDQGNDLERFCKGGTGFDCNFNFVDPFTDFRRCFEQWHNAVHLAVAGGDVNHTFATLESPMLAIFWPWHAFVDDVYEQYLCICDDGNHDYFGPNEEWDDFDRIVANISGSENNYSAFRFLSTSGTFSIPSSRNITFRAGSQITLNQGFSAQTGATFHAFIDACPRYGDQTPMASQTEEGAR